MTHVRSKTHQVTFGIVRNSPFTESNIRMTHVRSKTHQVTFGIVRNSPFTECASHLTNDFWQELPCERLPHVQKEPHDLSQTRCGHRHRADSATELQFRGPLGESQSPVTPRTTQICNTA